MGDCSWAPNGRLVWIGEGVHARVVGYSSKLTRRPRPDGLHSVERSLKVQLPKPEDHNLANSTLLEGSRRLGYACKVVPQNIGGTFERHARCGANCTIGCRGYLEGDGGDGKMSGCRVFLKPLLEATAKGQDSSSRVTLEGVDGFNIERVLFEDEKNKTRAIGAIGTLDTGDEGGKVRLVVLADRTVISAGTMNSPAILLRSGLKVSDEESRRVS